LARRTSGPPTGGRAGNHRTGRAARGASSARRQVMPPLAIHELGDLRVGHGVAGELWVERSRYEGVVDEMEFPRGLVGLQHHQLVAEAIPLYLSLFHEALPQPSRPHLD